LEGSEIARQFCHPILLEDLGQELCAPPFQVVCPFQAFASLDAHFCFLIYGRFAGRIFLISVPGSSAALSLSRLRPVTLRATLSGGLLFSSFRSIYCNGYATE